MASDERKYQYHPGWQQQQNGNKGNKKFKITISIGTIVIAAAILIAVFSWNGGKAFSLEGTWKNFGDSGFGQAQPGAVVIFEDGHCNFYSPQDTYAFYAEGDDYRLDLTSLFFAENLSFSVHVVDENLIEIQTGSKTISLTRVN